MLDGSAVWRKGQGRRRWKMLLGLIYVHACRNASISTHICWQAAVETPSYVSSPKKNNWPHYFSKSVQGKRGSFPSYLLKALRFCGTQTSPLRLRLRVSTRHVYREFCDYKQARKQMLDVHGHLQAISRHE
jgi:hypothetical protein